MATVRVVLWHALGAPVLTFLVASMPAMFFVSGALYARSGERRPWAAVIGDRFRRLLPPLWLFTAVCWTVMVAAASWTGTAVPWRNLWAWVLPLIDPSGTPWEGGWLSTPLWYLRVLTWLLLLGPAVVAVGRRWPRAGLAGAVLVVLALDQLDRTTRFRPAFAPQLSWQVGDLVLYGTFFAAGAWWMARRGAVRRRALAAIGAVAVLGAVVWYATQPVPDGIVNNSHPMHLLVGTAWLCVALWFRAPLASLATTGGVGRIVRWLGARALTVYLWHSAAVRLSVAVMERGSRLPAGVHEIVHLLLVAGFTVAAVMATGWAEDLAARRSVRWWPGATRRAGDGSTRGSAVPGGAQPSGAAVVTAASAGPTPRPPRAVQRAPLVLRRSLVPLAVVALLAGSVAATRMGDGPPERAYLRIPSQAPAMPQAGEEAAVLPGWMPDATRRLRQPVVDSAELTAIVDAWVRRIEVPGVVVGVAVPGDERWTYAVGSGRSTERRSPDESLDLMSITKLFTANLVYRYVDAGLIDLDAPLPHLDALPEFPYTALVTPRMLLGHRTGLTNYRDTDVYRDDHALVNGPVSAMAAVAEAPLRFEPGTRMEYSSANYLLLGFLLEQVTGRPFEELLADDLLQPLELRGTEHRSPEPGEPNFSTAGLFSTIDDLLTAGTALLREHVGLSDESFSAMTTLSFDAHIGAGSIGYCPCTTEPDGSTIFLAYGYSGGWAWVGYLPSHDLVVAVDLTDGLWTTPERVWDVMGLVAELGDAVRSGDLGT